ncbi:MAG: hypothetical protein AAF349_05155 [Cyanobacteria bacterium P01_A01_bin.68]
MDSNFGNVPKSPSRENLVRVGSGNVERSFLYRKTQNKIFTLKVTKMLSDYNFD